MLKYGHWTATQVILLNSRILLLLFFIIVKYNNNLKLNLGIYEKTITWVIMPLKYFKSTPNMKLNVCFWSEIVGISGFQC